MHVGFVYFVQVKSNMMFGVAYLVFVFYGGCGLKQNYLTTRCNGATVAVSAAIGVCIAVSHWGYFVLDCSAVLHSFQRRVIDTMCRLE